MGWLSKALGGVLSAIGLGSDDSAAKAQQAQLDQLKAQNQLDASNEQANVTQFDDDDTSTFTGSNGSNRGRRRQTGSTSSALGLGV